MFRIAYRKPEPGKPEFTRSLSLQFEFELSQAISGLYRIRITPADLFSFEVEQEECILYHESKSNARFLVRTGNIVECTDVTWKFPAIEKDRLFLVLASGMPTFKPVYELLSRMAVYNPIPAFMQQTYAPGSGAVLLGDGSNYGDALFRMKKTHLSYFQSVNAYLKNIYPPLDKITLTTDQNGIDRRVGLIENTSVGLRTIFSENISYGTLRSLAILTALFQPKMQDSGPSVVCIEEPETGLHPFASGALRDAIKDAATLRQVFVSSHSPDLLDDKDISPESILAVASDGGASIIGRLNASTMGILRDHLFTPGELLRQNHLRPATNKELESTVNQQASTEF